MKYDGIIFDLDGTLWSATQAICDTWNIVLKRHPELNRTMTVEELDRCMGLPMYEIAARLFPTLSEKMQHELMDECCVCENEYLAEHGGILYDGVEEVIEELSKTYPLFIVSNCQEGYIEAFLKAHHLEKYFTDTECWGRTRAAKGISNQMLIKRNNLKNPVYVGDTQGDKQSATDAGIPFIFAAYGFGQTDDWTYRINSFRQLLLVPEIKTEKVQ